MSKRILMALMAGLALLLMSVPVAAEHYDPPTRVARLSYVAGDASFSPAGERDWYRPIVNRPLYRGDRVWTDRRGRVELQVGGAAVRLDQYSALQVLDVSEDFAQFELTEGSMNLGVNHLYEGQVYEIATPTLALVVSEPGSYRIDVQRDGSTDVIVWRGRAEAYGERTSFPLREGDAVSFYDPGLRDYRFFRLPRPDGFDRFAFARDDRLQRSPSLRYVSAGMIGYADLDEYGYWEPVRSYGNVWFPRSVPSGWAPYRHGHWIHQEPWGWTWVDDMPWGFAPSHYGRWVQVGPRWGWMPGPRTYRPVYAPALVAFIGGSGLSLSISLGDTRPVGWFPLGPRDVYVPGYRVSRDYFTQVNVRNTTIINNTSITNIYNNYYVRDSDYSRIDYAYRDQRSAVTAVPADVFRGARAVQTATLPVSRIDTARAEVRRMAPVQPVVASRAGAEVARVKPSRETMTRTVVARRAPPALAERAGEDRGARQAREDARQVRVVGEPQRRVERAEIERSRERAVDRSEPRRSVEARREAREDVREVRQDARREAREDVREVRQDARREGREDVREVRQDARREAREDVREVRQDARREGREDAREVRQDARREDREDVREVRQDARREGREDVREVRQRGAERDAAEAQRRAAAVEQQQREAARARERQAEAARERAERAEKEERVRQREAAVRSERAAQQREAAERARAADRQREAAVRERAAERQAQQAREAQMAAERARAQEARERQQAEARERQADAARMRAEQAEQRQQAMERQQAQQRAAEVRAAQQREAQQREAQQREAQQRQAEPPPESRGRGRDRDDARDEEEDERESRGRGRERR